LFLGEITIENKLTVFFPIQGKSQIQEYIFVAPW
jgi:hypothetical protein